MQLSEIVERVAAARSTQQPLRIRGRGSKDFYGGLLAGELLDVSGYAGIVAYEPTELFVTARCGTPLDELEARLAEHGQMLACEPPHFSGATLGGCVAAGLAGPRRQQAGGVRDFVLGARLIDGRAEVLNFGGQVMKNVAGYDVSRLLAGSLGTLGVIAEVTLKVLPRPVAETTRRFELSAADAIRCLNAWGGQPLPISASFWWDGQLFVRFSGAAAAVDAACRRLGGSPLAEAEAFWRSVREQTHPAFAHALLWRLAVPSNALDAGLSGLQAIEWGGALRWYAGEQENARGAAAHLGGHAVLYRGPESRRLVEGCFTALDPAMLALHRRFKKAFDPQGILNPGRLYAEF